MEENQVQPVNLFDYFDYQEYLRDVYAFRKKQDSYFTYRFIASKLNIDHAYVVKVLQGQRHVSLKTAASFSKLLKHNKRQQEYFELLVLFSKAKANSEIKHYFEKLLTYIEVSPLKIEGHKFEFYQKWYYTAIRELIGISGFDGNYQKLASQTVPAISISQAKKSIQLLLKLKLITKNSDGSYSLSSRFITPSEKVQPLAIREFQKETIKLAAEALDNIPKEERDISTLTLSLSAQGLEKMKASLTNFRQELMRIANQDENVNRAYQINLQLFPITGPGDNKK